MDVRKDPWTSDLRSRLAVVTTTGTRGESPGSQPDGDIDGDVCDMCLGFPGGWKNWETTMTTVRSVRLYGQIHQYMVPVLRGPDGGDHGDIWWTSRLLTVRTGWWWW